MSCGENCNCKKLETGSKFFLVCFDAIFYKKILNSTKNDELNFGSDSEEDFDNMMGIIPNAMEKNGKKVIPVLMPGHGTMFSNSGLFLPFEAENWFKFHTKCDDIAIKFVREITEEEFKLDQKMRVQNETPQLLDYNTSQEIDDLIGNVEKGKLNVHVDPMSEQLDPLAGLFKDPFTDEE